MAAVKVSTRGDYASRALLSLALHADDGGPTSVRDIAERTGLPQPYLEQILLALKGAGLVRSKRGVGGGYVLARDPEEITLSDIVSAVDGPIVAGDFGQPHTDGACDHEGQCVLLAIWADVGEHMRQLPRRRRRLADIVADGPRRGPLARRRGRPPSVHSARRAGSRRAPSTHGARSAGKRRLERQRARRVVGWSKPRLAGVQERPRATGSTTGRTPR